MNLIRTSLSMNELLMSVLLPAMLLALLLLLPTFYLWNEYAQKREAPLRREIAQNFAEKWGRCDIAAKWDKAVPCQVR